MNTNRFVRCLIFAVLMFSLSATSFAQVAVGIAVRFGPPALPIYAQPICPGPGYFWTPGYWSWNDDYGYYWVPGTWVVAPVGLLWTPGYWGWRNGFYVWHPGYWGPHVGFYGGINYGFGYTGFGFFGGEWRGDRFFYNRSVTNINVVNVTNVYERRVVVNNTTRVSFNGGSGGVRARPSAEQERFAREPHREALADQVQHERSASRDRSLFASENHGRPAIAATGRAGEFRGRDVVAAREAGGKYREPKMSPREARENRGAEARSENRRDVPRPDNREHNAQARPNRPEQREQARQDKATQQRQERERARQDKATQQRQEREARQDKPQKRQEREQARQEREQARQEQKQHQQVEKQRAQQQKAERKQEQKRQREEQKREDRGPGR
jgi:DNA segregation ATPase FtsK/SpoIIIE-like protein